MEPLTPAKVLGFALLAFMPPFYRLSPASKSAKLWTIFYLCILASYIFFPQNFKDGLASFRSYVAEKPAQAALIAVGVGVPLKYIQQKLRFARLNAIKMKYGYTDDPASWEDMTVEQAQEIESNMAEGVSKALAIRLDLRLLPSHFINEDKKIEHQRMQATVHLMTAFVAYKVKSHNHSLVVARINEHHHRYGIKINSDDILYLIIHFGLAPVSWINRFGYRKLEPFEVNAIWVLWRENAVRMGVKYVPKTLQQAQEWRRNFEKTFRWREDANETMAMAMLNQVLYPVPGPMKGFVARAFASIVDWDKLEKLHPSPVIRTIAYDIFRLWGWLIREFGLPRLSPYQRSPEEPNKDGKMNFGHTPYDTMPWWQEATFWNRWGPRAWFQRLLGMPLPSKEYQSDGVPFEAMGAPHQHPATQAAIEEKVRQNAAILENAPLGYRSAVGFQANRLMPPVDGPTYGSDINTFPEGTPTMPNSPARFDKEYQRRGAGYSKVENINKPEDVKHFDAEEAAAKKAPNQTVGMDNKPHAIHSAPAVAVSVSP